MRRFSFSSLRVRLIILVLLAIIPTLGLTFYTGLEQRQIATHQAKDEALRLAHFASNRQRQLIEGAHQFLHLLAQLPQVRYCDPTLCSRLFADLLKQYPHYLNIGAIGLDGYIFASAIPPSKPINVAYRPYFQRALKTKKFTVGEYQIGRITGKPGVNLGYPVMDDRGKVKAVVYVVLDLTWLNQLTLQVDLPRDSILSLIDSDSTILARYPEAEKWVGKTMPEASVVKTILAKGEGMIETIGADGVRRLYAFTSFGSTVSQTDRVYVSIGIPSSAVFAQVERTLIRNLAFLLLISLLALSAAWFGGDLLVLRRLNPIVSATKRLGAGDLSARTGIVYGKGELNQLALTFDQMAESLELRESERKQAEEKLWESEERYRSLFENMLEGFAYCKMFFEDGKPQDFIYLDVNSAFEKLTGLKNVVGKRVTEVIPGIREADPDLFDIYARVSLTGKPEKFEMFIKSLKMWLSISVYSPEKEFFVAVFDDITDHKKAEEALKDSEERYRLLAENVTDIIWTMDMSLRFTYISPSITRIRGYSIKEAMAQRFEEVLTPASLKVAMEVLSEELEVEKMEQKNLFRSWTLELEEKCKDGSTIWTESTITFLRDPDLKPVGILGVTRDIAERKRAEEEKAALQEQFRQSQKMEAIGQLAGGVAHDFNNLLTVIKGYSQLSMMELKEGDPLKPNIEEVQKAADRAAGLTRQLLAFSRRQILEMKVLDLNTILRDLDKMLRRIIGEDIEMVTLLADDLGTVKADPGQIEQVIMNLAVNARDAMQKGGKLTIETANVELDEHYARNHVAVTPGRYAMLSVSDTGVGMTPEVRDRVFEPFFTTKGRDKGTGLGLSTVYGIVKQSGGNIWVYSEPGKGTTFKIYLPRVDEPLEEAREKVVQKEIAGRGETILVVEDEEKVRQLTVQILTKNGYTVLEAPQGDEASYICKQHKGPIHLMVMDVVMPGMNGRELAKSLASYHPEMKVLYMSGYTDNAIVHHGILERGLNFIQKPFTMDGLLGKIREVLDK